MSEIIFRKTADRKVGGKTVIKAIFAVHAPPTDFERAFPEKPVTTEKTKEQIQEMLNIKHLNKYLRADYQEGYDAILKREKELGLSPE